MNATAGLENPVVASNVPSLFDFADEDPPKDNENE